MTRKDVACVLALYAFTALASFVAGILTVELFR